MRPLRVLFSYHFFRGHDVAQIISEELRDLAPDVMADSGAYSAWTLGKTITVDEYVAWLQRWGDWFTCAAALDVIGDARASFTQTLELRDKLGSTAYPLIPVVHSNDEGGALLWLDKYLKEGFDYIGISPTGAIYRDPGLMQRWLQLMFEARPEHVRYHGFGVTGWDAMTAFPWHSVDSTTWLAGFQYASLTLFDVERGKYVRINLRDGADILKHARVLQRYGLVPNDVRADRLRANRDKLVAVSISTWQHIEEFLGRNADTRVYLGATGGPGGADGSPKVIGRSMRVHLGAAPTADPSPAVIGQSLRGVS